MAKLSYVKEHGKRLLSYSTRQTFKACPRKYQMQNVFHQEGEISTKSSVDFAFGHSVAAGVQALMAGKSRDRALLELFSAWDADFDGENPRSKKSLPAAIEAFEIFERTYYKTLSKDWEVAQFRNANGDLVPAVELTFRVDLDGVFNYQGHIDLVLKHIRDPIFLTLELKTTSASEVHEAMYKHSDQALGYSIVLDKIARTAYVDGNSSGIGSYSVLYLVYKSGKQEFEILPFTKSLLHRAEFLVGLMMDVHYIKLMDKVGHYPKNGSACYDFFRPCEFFTICDLSNETLRAQLERKEAMAKARAEREADAVLESGNFANMKADELSFDFHITELLDMQVGHAHEVLVDDEVKDLNLFGEFMMPEVPMPTEEVDFDKLDNEVRLSSVAQNERII